MANEDLDHETPINSRMDIWLTTCRCDAGDEPYCTYCTLLWDARDRIELLESAMCARAFDDGQVPLMAVADHEATVSYYERRRE